MILFTLGPDGGCAIAASLTNSSAQPNRGTCAVPNRRQMPVCVPFEWSGRTVPPARAQSTEFAFVVVLFEGRQQGDGSNFLGRTAQTCRSTLELATARERVRWLVVWCRLPIWRLRESQIARPLSVATGSAKSVWRFRHS